MVRKTAWGCKPKPPKIPSRQIESRHDRVKVNEFSVATKSVVAIQMDVSPRRRRGFWQLWPGPFAFWFVSYLVSSRDRIAEL